MADSLEKTIFKNGSSTYYFSSVFFPKAQRQDVFALYSFVRIADDYVDAIPQQRQQFLALREHWDNFSQDGAEVAAQPGDSVDVRVVKNMVRLMREYLMPIQWIESFLDAMQSDLEASVCTSLDDSLAYVYGSAEVIGCMMARILGLPEAALPAARSQGRAMQWINFIRDIAEDNSLGRCYIPRSELRAVGLADLTEVSVRAQPQAFKRLIRSEIERYETWQAEAEAGYEFIPKRLRIPLQTAADMYTWTARQIEREPLVVFERKVRPGKLRVIRHAAALGFCR